MQPDTVCKTVHQYNKEEILEEDMKKLQEIATDYCKVKNYVFQRYSGVNSLSKLYPGYTVQNEMTACGFRQELGLPSVYFYLAVFDALGNIKSQWTRTKRQISKKIGINENLSAKDRHYLRFLLKVNNAFEQVVNQKKVELSKDLQKKYDELAAEVDFDRLNRYLCRQVRKCHKKQYSTTADGFFVSERAYRYADHGIYISTKEKRRRIFVPLTDNNQYKNQIYIKLYPEEKRLEIKVAVDVAVRNHTDYESQIGVAFGMYTMLTSSNGNRYGEQFGEYQTTYADWIREQTINYNQNRVDNPGRKKYNAKKSRLEEQLHSYINHEINRFLQNEKPQTIYLVKLPIPQKGGINRKINNSVALWQRGYIRNRLTQKCREQSIEIVEVLGKGISNECSQCGGIGIKNNGLFSCKTCGYCEHEKINTAKNILKRGLEGRIIH